MTYPTHPAAALRARLMRSVRWPEGKDARTAQGTVSTPRKSARTSPGWKCAINTRQLKDRSDDYGTHP
jgi:hypothetical protein